jgi:hypothetical protein
VYESAISQTGFVPPVNLMDAIEKTVRYEFIEDHHHEQGFNQVTALGCRLPIPTLPVRQSVSSS